MAVILAAGGRCFCVAISCLWFRIQVLELAFKFWGLSFFRVKVVNSGV